MLTQVKRIALVAVTACGANLCSSLPTPAADPGLQIAAGILQGLASGLGGGVPMNPGGMPGGMLGGMPGGMLGGGMPGFPPVIGPNPVVFDSGWNPGGVSFDAIGRPINNFNQTTANASAYDPSRNVVDPGSYQTSTNMSRDSMGNEIEIVTNSWTSNGVPHSDTQRRYLTPSGGGGFSQFNQFNQREIKSVRPGGGYTPRTGFRRVSP
jgi:hypothetical protein